MSDARPTRSGTGDRGRSGTNARPANAPTSGGTSPVRGDNARRADATGSRGSADNPTATPNNTNTARNANTNANTNTANESPTIPQSETQDETFVVIDREKKNKGGRPVGFSPKSKQVEKLQNVHEQNVQLAGALVAVMNGVATSVTGFAGAHMTESESELISDPLVRILDRLTPKTLEQMQKFSDPLTLIIGLSIWGARIVAERPQRQKPPPTLPSNAYVQGETPQDVQPPTAGGDGVNAAANVIIHHALEGGGV